jgi:hypothetical protein
MTKDEVASALDHAVSLGFLSWWTWHDGGQVAYRPVRGRQPAGKVVTHWREAGEYLASERLFDRSTGETLTPSS